ncbi:MAG: cytochrome c peroxidase, partial [Candidatus Binatia bacterium]
VLRVFVIDRERRIRNVYSSSFLHADTVLSDLRTLEMEHSAASGVPDVPLATTTREPATNTEISLHGAGDVKDGYEAHDYRSRSKSLASRDGEAVDLMALLAEPPLGLPPVPVPPDNPVTAAKVALGRKLFFDRRLSRNRTLSCAMCHIPEQGFTSHEMATAVGIEGRTVRRNAPTLYNVGHAELLFHDGRERLLEQQIWGPLLAVNEMGNPSVGFVLDTLASLPDYAGLFEAAFEDRGPTMETLGMALASYQRTLISGHSPFDRWRYGKDEAAVSEAAARGYELFTGKAGCSNCHRIGDRHALFTDHGLHDTGIGYRRTMARDPETLEVQVGPGVFVTVDAATVAAASEPRAADLGRYEITEDPADRWKYRTPSLRNIALTAPYMHDGSIATLREVVEFYDGGGVEHELLDANIEPLGLETTEIEDLVAFLDALTGDDVDILLADAFAAPVGDPH